MKTTFVLAASEVHKAVLDYLEKTGRITATECDSEMVVPKHIDEFLKITIETN